MLGAANIGHVLPETASTAKLHWMQMPEGVAGRAYFNRPNKVFLNPDVFGPRYAVQDTPGSFSRSKRAGATQAAEVVGHETSHLWHNRALRENPETLLRLLPEHYPDYLPKDWWRHITPEEFQSLGLSPKDAKDLAGRFAAGALEEVVPIEAYGALQTRPYNASQLGNRLSGYGTTSLTEMLAESGAQASQFGAFPEAEGRFLGERGLSYKQLPGEAFKNLVKAFEGETGMAGASTLGGSLGVLGAALLADQLLTGGKIRSGVLDAINPFD